MKPIVIAHRGASAYLPEHTLPCVAAAHTLGADYIEQDIVLSRDGVPMVLHDIYLESTTNVAQQFPDRGRGDGRFYAIDFDLAELKTLSVHERVDFSGSAVFSDRFPLADLQLRIPTLSEEIILIEGLNKSRGMRTGYYIEMKSPAFHTAAGLDIARSTIEVLEAAGLHHENAAIFFQCFDPETLRYLKHDLNSPLPLIQLMGDNSWEEPPGVDFDLMGTEQGLDDVASYADGIGPWIPQLFKADGLTPSQLVGAAHARGLLVHAYTLRADSLESGFKSFEALHKGVFLDAGIDGVFSDFPDITREFIDSHFNTEVSNS
ncbi:MAG: glycerophosphodiester phosphodiesterase [Luminiphilus sp.]|nr:glycerophosphodiester phosphodiesterase [Luminiphilus sp.]